MGKKSTRKEEKGIQKYPIKNWPHERRETSSLRKNYIKQVKNWRDTSTKKKQKKKTRSKGKKKKVCTRVLAHRDNKNEFLLSYSQNTAPLDNVQEFRNPKRNIQFDKKCEQMKNYGRSIWVNQRLEVEFK